MTPKEIRKKSKRESDYIISLFITNEISLIVTWILSSTRVTPNQITAASIITGVLCGFFYGAGFFFTASLLLFVSHILDCTDGNLARTTQKFSDRGRLYDMAGDRISEVVIFMGIGYYFFNSNSVSYSLIALSDGLLLILYYYIVDLKSALGFSAPKQRLTRFRFKDVSVKWGLLEPVYYGLILLAPLGLIHIQLIIICLLAIAGLLYQGRKIIFEHTRS